MPQLSIIVNSKGPGARNLSPDGSTFEVLLDQPLAIPADASNVTASVEAASIWWTVANVTELNNKIRCDDGSQSVVLTIPNGLYDLKALNKTVARLLEAAGVASDLVTLTPDSATQRVVLTLAAGAQITWADDTPRVILGFDAGVITTTTLAPNVAALNYIDAFQIVSDLCQGIAVNGRFSGVLARVPINVAPGSQILFEPRRPARASAQQLAGANRSGFQFRLVDQEGRAVNTASEAWSARVTMRWE